MILWVIFLECGFNQRKELAKVSIVAPTPRLENETCALPLSSSEPYHLAWSPREPHDRESLSLPCLLERLIENNVRINSDSTLIWIRFDLGYQLVRTWLLTFDMTYFDFKSINHKLNSTHLDKIKMLLGYLELILSSVRAGLVQFQL